MTQAQKPAAVAKVEKGNAEMNEQEVVSVITAYQLAVGHYTALARALLAAYDGYECKEPEPGKFTMVFRCDCTLVNRLPMATLLCDVRERQLLRPFLVRMHRRGSCWCMGMILNNCHALANWCPEVLWACRLELGLCMGNYLLLDAMATAAS